VPLNVSCPERKSQEFALGGFNDAALGRVNDQLQAVLQVIADVVQHSFTGTPTLHQDREVIGISSKAMAAFLKLFVQRVEHDVSQQRR